MYVRYPSVQLHCGSWEACSSSRATELRRPPIRTPVRDIKCCWPTLLRILGSLLPLTRYRATAPSHQPARYSCTVLHSRRGVDIKYIRPSCRPISLRILGSLLPLTRHLSATPPQAPARRVPQGGFCVCAVPPPPLPIHRKAVSPRALSLLEPCCQLRARLLAPEGNHAFVSRGSRGKSGDGIYRGSSLVKAPTLVGPCSSLMPRDLW